MAITITFAPPGYGKTCFNTHMANLAAFDRSRTRAMQAEIFNKQQNGFNAIKTVPAHCVSANYDITLRKFGYRPRASRRINPYKLGFANPYVETHFSLPHEFIVITEAQKYFNSRLAMYYPDWQSRFFEAHRHNDMDIFLDTQRPMLIDVNIRELSCFIEIIKLDISYDRFGMPSGLKWRIRRIENSSLFERYMLSGKKDKNCYMEDIVKADYNVFSCYDSQSCKPKFYSGHFTDDFDYNTFEPRGETIEDYIKYLEANDDELPHGFYRKRSDLT